MTREEVSERTSLNEATIYRLGQPACGAHSSGP